MLASYGPSPALGCASPNPGHITYALYLPRANAAVHRKQLHSATARYEAVLRAVDAAGSAVGIGPATAAAAAPAGGAPAGKGGGGAAAAAAAGGSAGAAAPAAAGAAAAGGGAGVGGGGSVAAMYESFTLGWLNLLVQHLWLPLLEKFISTLAAEKLQIVLNEVGCGAVEWAGVGRVR